MGGIRQENVNTLYTCREEREDNETKWNYVEEEERKHLQDVYMQGM